ncbi:hypothetical protein ASC89_21725 [Devosia sp. Root413D1]|uniref:DUF3800 domain-containing protein n=1 Tax=Devosia sp. Root413D1 TaxID=1736531 RepID=UPI0006FBA27A|nr:DUF3800 domain-containing protein [Devosia sp. Root413D1]KQW75567.1 hypothetical protein ASC89_21725 [Devosia sp. Root413D1]
MPAAPQTLYFDEAGFTGYNLLDSAQPVFAIASTDLEPEAASEILVDSFPSYRGAEYKLSNVWRTNARQGLLRFAEHAAKLSDRTLVYIIQKRMAVLTKMADFLIEPIITHAGYDFYADGFCWKYSNYMYFGFTLTEPPELLDRLLAIYMEFSRDPNQQSLRLLQGRLRLMANSAGEKTRPFLEQMAAGAEAFNHFNDIDNFRSSNELHTGTMIAMVSRWRQRSSRDFAVVHDASSVFLRSRRMWENITNSEVAETSQILGDGTDAPFPLRVLSTLPVDSRDNASVQFCDILAGLSVKMHGVTRDNPDYAFFTELQFAGLSAVMIEGITPLLVFPDQIPPRKLEGPDVVDQLAAIIQSSEDRRG